MTENNVHPVRGSLTVVGTGISLGQITAQALGAIQSADIVLTVIGDAPSMAYVVNNCRAAENLLTAYQLGRPRREAYAEMVERVMAYVRGGKRVCFALYGHPGVLALPANLSIARAREEGFLATMLPGISAEACLFADLNIDPGFHGLQSYDASTFLRGDKIWDPTSLLVLWQIGAVGDAEFHLQYPNERLGELVEKLAAVYGEAHEATVYEAATLTLRKPRIDRILIGNLLTATLSATSTLLIEPRKSSP